MSTIRAEFSADQVAAYGVSTIDPLSSIETYAKNTGLRVPILVDSGADPTCWTTPGEDYSLYAHFRDRIGFGATPPFPLQVVVGPDGRFAYLSRDHHPDALMAVLRELVAEP